MDMQVAHHTEKWRDGCFYELTVEPEEDKPIKKQNFFDCDKRQVVGPE
jgi:hypothetical protein